MDTYVASKQTKQQVNLVRQIAIAFITLALLATGVSPTIADERHRGRFEGLVVSPRDTYNGETYSDWSAQWFQWVYSLPFTHHPLIDGSNTDCSVGQRGHVWFIGGTLGGGTAVNRNCTIPEGTALFLAVANTSWDNAGCNGAAIQPTSFTTDELRANAQMGLDGFLDDRGQCTIDGVPVRNLSGLHTKFRVESPVFDYTVPSVDSLLIPINGSCYQNLAADELTIAGAVGDGVYVLIKPLRVGHHTIRFGNPGGMALGNVYNITVTPVGP